MANQTSFHQTFKYDSQKDEYTFQIRKKHNGWWWLLLLLLLPLLLIRCNHDITVTVIDSETKEPLSGIAVEASYTSHILLQKGKFLNHKVHSYEDETDSKGKVVLKNVECCIFSYIFYAGSDIKITANDSETVKKSYHYTRNVTIELKNDAEVTLTFRTIDKKTDELLPHCDLVIDASKSGKMKPTTSGNGEFKVKGLRPDEEISIKASKDGYGPNNTTIHKVKVADLIDANQDMRDIPLLENVSDCSGGQQMPKDGLNSIHTFKMGVRDGTNYSFRVEIDGGGIYPDHFIIYAGPNPDPDKIIFDKNVVDEDFSDVLHSNSSTITVEVETDPDNPSGSDWKYTVNCPGK